VHASRKQLAQANHSPTKGPHLANLRNFTPHSFGTCPTVATYIAKPEAHALGICVDAFRAAVVDETRGWRMRSTNLLREIALQASGSGDC
jgi:hypothetical protein